MGCGSGCWRGLEGAPAGARLWVRQASGREVLEQQRGGVLQALAKMLAVGGVGVWIDDRITDVFDWSDQARRLHDLPLDAELSPQLLFGRVRPTIAARWLRKFSAASRSACRMMA